MSVTNVYHKSREHSITLNFAETENTLSWAFASESDGEVFDVSMVNVDSYTIQGAPVLVPFSVLAALTYNVGIVKTTAGQPASITFKVRREINKNTSISVPDFGIHTGRWLYILLDSGTQVLKLDSELLKPANYISDGAWTLSPIVETINLPTLPDGAVYTCLQFVKNNGEEKIFIAGGVANSFRIYGSYIKVSDDSVWNLELNAQDSFTYMTEFLSPGLIYNTPKSTLYDFINEILYVKTQVGTNGYAAVRFYLNDLLYQREDNNSFNARYIDVNHQNIVQFNPILQRFISVGDTSLIESRNFNYKVSQNNGSKWGYRYDVNLAVSVAGSMGNIGHYNEFGVTLFSIGSNYSVYGCTNIKAFHKQKSIFATYQNHFVIRKWDPLLNYQGQTLLATGQSISSLLGCTYSDLFFGFTSTSAGVLQSRLIVFDTSSVDVAFGYLDFASNVAAAQNNQLII